MKKLILLVAVAFIGCTPNEKEQQIINPKTCDCYKETWIKPILGSQNSWYANGYKEFYSNNCSDDGKVLPGHSGNGVEFQYRIKCTSK